MDYTSGELLFHSKSLGQSGRKIYSNEIVNDEFWGFLETRSQNHGTIDSFREKTLTINRLKLQCQTKSALSALSLQKKQWMVTIEHLNSLFLDEILGLQKRLDHRLMQLVLQYYSILNHEMSQSRRQLQFERRDKTTALEQAMVLREIQIFACHIKMESKEQVILSTLSQDSVQFERCAKAVKDNLPSGEFCRVLSVFKLQNSFLSKSLQMASEKMTTGKIKGLFCVLSKENFYRFSVFGLHCQTPDVLPSLAEEWLQTPWFSSSSSPQTHNSFQTGRRLSTKRLSGEDDISLIRFRRHSGSGVLSLQTESGSVGLLVGLCRVLVLQMLTVDGHIGDSDVFEARRLHYDTVFSSLTEEYVLLRPEFVLPEFFMLTQYPSIHPSNIDNDNAITSHSFSVPPMLRLGRQQIQQQQVEESVWDLLANNLSNHLKEEEDRSTVEEHSNNNNNNNTTSPRNALMKKQSIVVNLQDSIEDFKRNRNKMLKKHRKALDRLLR